MPERLDPESAMTLSPSEHEQDRLRTLNRSPHPYHHQKSDLPHPSDRFWHNASLTATNAGDAEGDAPSTLRLPSFTKESTPASESGTEADDEHFLKGLPAPKVKLHKGLRGRNEPLSGANTPLLSPAIVDGDHDQSIDHMASSTELSEHQSPLDILKRRRVLVRRATEVGIIIVLAFAVSSNKQAAAAARIWRTDFQLVGLLYAGLLILYPLRVIFWAYRTRQPSTQIPLQLPSNFDPAPLLYPPAITIFVSILVSANNPAIILPNIILSISSIPQQLVPKIDLSSAYDPLHWVLSCLPLMWRSLPLGSTQTDPNLSLPSPEVVVLLYPLHRALCLVLHYLTTTSLLTAELQLLSIALVNVLLLASSPQVVILQALLWGGGLSVLILCGPVIQWGIALARVPKWRFRTSLSQQRRGFFQTLIRFLSLRRLKNDVVGSTYGDQPMEASASSENEDEPTLKPLTRTQTLGNSPYKSLDTNSVSLSTATEESPKMNGFARRHTLSNPDRPVRHPPTHTPSGRRKRATSISVRPFLKLTQFQATLRTWLYASYVYLCIMGIILVGIRAYVETFALNGNEPIGWALGYLFGDLPWFRFQVVSANLERWICLPPRLGTEEASQCYLGWVQHIRHDDFGEANTRLLLCAYWIAIIAFGLVVVFQLKEAYEVDTRRKVFHFMMVGMLLPATFVDPTFAALALSLILAIFLILDLLRASQLPPLSKPIASFLAPYVDGRDFRGPVVISHIFLLIGCAIPLWLALASLPRSGSGYVSGWEIPTREVSMVAGVICVGLGDAAASLIGRRYGHRKWLWGGGKSLEGSVAFAVAVFLGLAAAAIWLRVGGWPMTGEDVGLVVSMRNAGICASVASLTEAVLTGGNDNVVVPVILWTCVKSLGV